MMISQGADAPGRPPFTYIFIGLYLFFSHFQQYFEQSNTPITNSLWDIIISLGIRLFLYYYFTFKMDSGAQDSVQL